MKTEGKFTNGARLQVDLKVAELIKMTAYQRKRLADADLSVADHSLAEGASKALADEVRGILAKEGFADPDFIIELVQAEVEDALAADKALSNKIAELRKNKLAYYSSAITRFQPPNSEPTTRFPNPSMDAD